MVEPPMIPRNVERAQSEGRDPVEPRPGVLEELQYEQHHHDYHYNDYHRADHPSPPPPYGFPREAW